jgi:2'-5' RNA ligase
MNGDASERGKGDRNTIRTFIAINLPTQVLQMLAATQEQLQEYLRGQGIDRSVRWSPIKNLHLTLRFLGDTTARQREQMTARLQEVAAESSPFTLRVDGSGRGLGGFPNLRQPRVLWSGVGGDIETLKRVQAAVEAAAQGVGFAPEEKPYSPHLTLARAAREADRRALAKVGEAVTDIANVATESAPVDFQVDRLIFYRSELGAGGSRYTVLAELPFGG